MSVEDFFYTDPPQDDPSIQDRVAHRTDLRRIEGHGFEWMDRGQGTFLHHQTVVHRLISTYDRLLLVHETGTGKTCAAAGAAEIFRKEYFSRTSRPDFVGSYLYGRPSSIRRAVVLVRNELLGHQFREQLVCVCSDPSVYRDLNIARNRDRTRTINSKISDYYLIFGHERFFNMYVNSSDDELLERFDESLFIVDEVHNLIDVTRTPPPPMYTFYNRLFHLLRRSKVLMMTATPMINRPDEIQPLMNLILPEDRQMDIKDFTTVTRDEFFESVNGYISYVRSHMEGPPVVAKGVTVPVSLDVDGEIHHNTVTVYPSVMGEIQRLEYEDARGHSDIHQSQRMRSNVSIDKKHSAKFDTIIDLIQDAKHNVFVYSSYVDNGIEAFSEWLRREGFEELILQPESQETPSRYCDTGTETAMPISKGLRYGVISDRSPHALIDLFNHPDNRHGEYIKVMLSSPIGREGISLHNVTQIHMVDSSWNNANNHQGESRSIRVNSHKDIEDENPTIEIFRHVALPYPMTDREIADYLGKNIRDPYRSHKVDNEIIDLSMYAVATSKQIFIDRIMDFIRSSAIDCHLNWQRNRRRPDDSLSYREFQCQVPETPGGIDIRLSSVSALDVDLLREAFRRRSVYPKRSLMVALQIDRYRLEQIVAHIINRSIRLTDRLGFPRFLSYNDSLYYLSDFEDRLQGTDMESFYARLIPITTHVDFLYREIYRSTGDDAYGAVRRFELDDQVSQERRRFTTDDAHDLMKFTTATNKHGMMARSRRVGEVIRVLDRRSGRWRDATPREYPELVRRFQDQYQRTEARINSPVYGRRNQGRFLIVNNLGRQATTDARRRSTGRVCDTIQAATLIDIAWYLHNEILARPGGRDEFLTPVTEGEQFGPIDDIDLTIFNKHLSPDETDDLERLRDVDPAKYRYTVEWFLQLVSETFTRQDLCVRIEDALASLDLIVQ